MMLHPGRPHKQEQLAQMKQFRQLQTAAAQLRSLHDRLQKEQLHLLQQQQLIAALVQVLGQHRAALQHQDELLCAPAAEVQHEALQQLLHQEQQLLQQLQGCPYVCAPADSGCDSTPAVAIREDRSSPSSSSGGPWQHSRGGGGSTSSMHQRQQRCASSELVSEDSFSTAADASAVPQPAAPEHDPFMLLRAIFDQPFEPCARSITLPELRAKWATDVQLLSTYLEQLEGGMQADDISTTPALPSPASEPCISSSSSGHGGAASSAEQQAAARHTWHQQQRQRQHNAIARGIRTIQFGMFGLTNSLAMADRVDLFVDLQLTNWLTGERLQEPCKHRHREALRALQLTPVQKQRLVAGFKFFPRLLNPVIAERQQLHMRGVDTTSPQDLERSQQSAPAVAAAASEPSAPAAAAAVVPVISSQGARLHAQAEQVVQLRVLAAKDRMLRGAQIAYVLGCLSWVQQAKLRVSMSPFNVNIGILCVVLMEELQAQQQQQQQQQASA